MTDAPSPAETALSIGQLARLSGVTVRTLHHYDAIGLLSPRPRPTSEYRAYGPAEAERLQRILFYRELELPLDRIKTLLDDPTVDEREHLRRQHTALGERIERLQRVCAAVEATLEAKNMQIDLTPAERLEVFGPGTDPVQFEDEVRERWGDTDTYRQSAERARHRSKDDWARVTAEGARIEADLAAALVAGETAAGPAAMDLAERLREHMSASFYDMSHAMQRDVSALYVDDPRFRKHYEELTPGLAQFVRDAIVANAARHGA